MAVLEGPLGEAVFIDENGWAGRGLRKERRSDQAGRECPFYKPLSFPFSLTCKEGSALA